MNLILESVNLILVLILGYLDSRGPLPSAVVGLDRDWKAVFLTQPVILVILAACWSNSKLGLALRCGNHSQEIANICRVSHTRVCGIPVVEYVSSGGYGYPTADAAGDSTEGVRQPRGCRRHA